MERLRNRALIVDDEPPIRVLLVKSLRSLGYECSDAEEGRKALDVLARENFDLVLLDMKMPGVSGLQVLKTLRLADRDTCVVMLTAIVDASLAAEATRLGADDYVTKPCDLAYLKDRLTAAMAKRELARRNKADSRPDDRPSPNATHSRDLIADLVHQQVAAFERSLDGVEDGDTPQTHDTPSFLRRLKPK